MTHSRGRGARHEWGAQPCMWPLLGAGCGRCSLSASPGTVTAGFVGPLSTGNVVCAVEEPHFLFYLIYFLTVKIGRVACASGYHAGCCHPGQVRPWTVGHLAWRGSRPQPQCHWLPPPQKRIRISDVVSSWPPVRLPFPDGPKPSGRPC